MKKPENVTVIEIKEDEEALMEICEAANKVLTKENHINVEYTPAIATICYQFLKQSVAYLNKNKSPGQDVSINMMGMFDIGISYREGSEDSEKSGNYTPFFIAGQEIKLLIKEDSLTEQDEDE